MATEIFILTFLAATILIFGIWVFVGKDASQDVIRKRMTAVRKAEHRGDVSLGLKLVRDEMMSSVPTFHRLLLRWSWTSKLQDFMLQAGSKTKPGKLLVLSAVLGVGSYLLASLFYSQLLITVPIGLIALSIPFLIVAWKRSQRLRQFEERFPQALDLLSRAIRAGHAFTTGLEMIGKESPEPIAGEFRTAFDEQNFGLPLRDALLNLTERVPLIDVRLFVTALLVQKETGGNLAEILDSLARVIRDRFRIYREVQVRTAQGRLTAMLLICLPIFMMIGLNIIEPHYMRLLYDDQLGPYMLSGAAVLQVIGSLILWKIIHIEV